MGCWVVIRRVGDHPLSKGEGDAGGIVLMSEEEKKFLARVTEPHLEQLM